MYIGCYTEKLGHILGDKLGEGVYTCKLNEDGSLTQLCEPAPSRNPSFVRTTPDNRFLYAAHENMEFDGKANNSSITSFSID